MPDGRIPPSTRNATFDPAQLAYIQERERACQDAINAEFKHRLESEPDFWVRHERARILQLHRRMLRLEQQPPWDHKRGTRKGDIPVNEDRVRRLAEISMKHGMA